MDTAHEWISAEFQNLAEVLADYDPYLALEWIPPEQWHLLNDKSQVFKVIDTRHNKIVLFASSVSNPKEILARVWGMDQKNGNVVENMEIENRAAQVLKLKRVMAEREAQMDFSAFIIKNQKNSWQHDGIKRDAEFRNLGSPKKHIT